jgi:ATP synthase protein I
MSTGSARKGSAPRRRGRRSRTAEISPARLALRYGPRALLAVAVPLVPISWAVGGWRAAAGGAAGLLVVAGFFAISVVLVEAANRVHPSMTLPVALTEYSVKVIVLGAVAFAVPDSWGSARPAFAIALIVGTLAWLASQALGVWRAPLRYVDMSLAEPDRRPVNR